MLGSRTGQGTVVIKLLTSGLVIAGLLAALQVVGTHANVLMNAPHSKGDRLDSRSTEASCGDWPYYHHACPGGLANTNLAKRKRQITARTNHRLTSFRGFL
jgi:hypothetical protein